MGGIKTPFAGYKLFRNAWAWLSESLSYEASSQYVLRTFSPTTGSQQLSQRWEGSARADTGAEIQSIKISGGEIMGATSSGASIETAKDQ